MHFRKNILRARVRNAPTNREFQYSDLLEKTDNFHSRRGCRAHVTICVHRLNRLELAVSVSHRLQIRCRKSCGGPTALSTRVISVLAIRDMDWLEGDHTWVILPPISPLVCWYRPSQRFSRRIVDDAFLFISQIAALGFRREIVRHRNNNICPGQSSGFSRASCRIGGFTVHTRRCVVTLLCSAHTHIHRNGREMKHNLRD